MAKDLTGNLETEIATSEHRPIELYIVFLDDYTLYFTDHDENIEFFTLDGLAQTYTAIALSRSEVKTNISNKIDSVTVRLDNINRAMTDYITSYEFRGRRMVILRVYENYLDNMDDYITIFDGLMDNPAIGEQVMGITVKSRLGTLDKSIPRRLYQVYCNWEFGSTECTIDRLATQISGITVDAQGSTTNIVVISGSAYEALDNDYFKYGTVQFTVGNNSGENRLITYSSGALSTVGISGIKMGIAYAVDTTPVGATVTLQQGCDKTIATCEDSYDNLDNYGGFPTIPQLLVVR